MKDNKKKPDKKWYKKRENYLIIFGFVIVLVAISTPFSIIYFNQYEYNLIKFVELGSVGDFFGGTTVGLLTLASLIFVTAAMFMQKEELELQRKEVTATRKEYEITNMTMKKQSFDSTFFNLIDLHQSILSQVKFKDSQGRDAFEKMYLELKKSFENDKDKLWKVEFFHKVFSRDIIDENLINTFSNADNNVILSTYEDFLENEEQEVQLTDSDQYIQYLYEQKEWIKKLTSNPLRYVKAMKDTDKEGLFDFLLNNDLLFNNKLNDSKSNTLNNLDIEWKRNYYNGLYISCENEIGHYYRNLYRIVKYIQEYDFANSSYEYQNEKINFSEKKNYRAILRAQLSSYELLMLYYNVCYSDKGYKFKKLLASTDFFDDHLVLSDFIWMNDQNELEYFKYK